MIRFSPEYDQIFLEEAPRSIAVTQQEEPLRLKRSSVSHTRSKVARDSKIRPSGSSTILTQCRELCMHNLTYLGMERIDLMELDLWLVSFGLLSSQDHTSYHVSLRFLAQPMSQTHYITHGFALS